MSFDPPAIAGFSHTPATKIVFGKGSISQLPSFVKQQNASHVFMVSDPGLADAGHVDAVARLLTDAGLVVTVFAESHENPTTADAAAAVRKANQVNPDLILGLGGGSSLDTAKACNLLMHNPGEMADYRGHGKVPNPVLPFIAVPTTHGTGSETQSFALIGDEDTHQKMACGDPKLLALAAILDPQLTLTQPRRVAACTSLDAISHAVESFVCTRRNPVSIAYARESFRLTNAHFDNALAGDDLDARGAMLLGAAYAGLAIENSMLGAAHSAANPLTAHHDVTHGHAVGLMLPHVVRFNASVPEIADYYQDLAAAVGLADVDTLIARLEKLLVIAGLPTTLSELGINITRHDGLADEAASQWTAGFNPRAITADDFSRLYQAAS